MGNSHEFGFLAGGGDTGALIRAKDWRGSSLGPIESWPQSLRSALSICLGSSFQIAIYWGPDLALLYNDAWSPILGRKHPQALGRPGREVWPEIWDTIGPMFAQVLETGAPTRSKDQLLAMYRHGFTEECYFDYTFSPIRGEDGKVGGIFNAVVETTFRVINERRTRLLNDLGEQLSKAQSPREACNAAATTLAHATADLPFCLLYLPTETGQLELRACVGSKEDSNLAPKLLSASESPSERPAWPTRPVEGSAVTVEGLAEHFGAAPAGGPWPEPCTRALVAPLGGETAVPTGILVAGLSPRLALDSEYRAFIERIAAAIGAAVARGQAREQERQRLQALSELDRAKNTFFSNISHELRTPLTLMVGPLDELLHRHDGALDERSHELLTVARRNCGRLLKLVNALLDFSRIEAGRIQATFEPLDIARFTQDLVSVFRSAIERAGLELQVDYPATGTIVYVDRHMWETIVFNLLSNALKYTLTGSIRVSLAERKGRIELCVSDTGTGIPSYALPRLFERFYRVPNVRGRTHEGTGIGLALVQELVRLHGGSIEVASEENVGTTFKVSIPTGTQHLPTEHIQPAAQAHQAPTVASAYVAEAELWVIDSEGGMRDSSGEPLIAPGELIPPVRTETAQNGTVLLVEDNADMRAYVQSLLARNFRIRTATDGEDALEQIRQDCPDLVLSDVMMPRLDGFGLLEAIRSDPHLREVPVILLSARAGEEARIEGLERGADDYLVKPFTARELEARVQAQLNLARLRGEVNAALREADRRKDEFLATLAHELRNPLAPIRQAARIASLPNVSTAQLHWSTDIINRQTQHMAVLLDDLLDLSRITRGRLELRKAPVELVPIIETAVETARPLIEARQHTLSVDVSSELIPLYVDSLRIAQALANLLTNAAKYTDPGGHIRLHAVCDGDEVIIRVSDTGIGIAPDKLSNVFEMFSQVKSPIDRSEGGLGIGLALVKGVVELHGGRVFAMSEGLGQGSTFTIVLPRAQRTSPDASAVSRSESRTPGRKRKVLIVDDNRDAAASLAALLQSEGHETRVAFSPEDGLALAQTFLPNTAVLDIGMPRINGYELARRLRAAYPDGGLRLIAVTGWGQSEDKRQAEAAGFDHHLTKPVDFEALLAALDAHQPTRSGYP